LLLGTWSLRKAATGSKSACSDSRRKRAESRQPAAASPDTAPLVQVHDARKIFHNGTWTVAALDGVSIEVGSWRRLPGALCLAA
jgi:hypothetical protein